MAVAFNYYQGALIDTCTYRGFMLLLNNLTYEFENLSIKVLLRFILHLVIYEGRISTLLLRNKRKKYIHFNYSMYAIVDLNTIS